MINLIFFMEIPSITTTIVALTSTRTVNTIFIYDQSRRKKKVYRRR